jgi:hypothetical protein
VTNITDHYCYIRTYLARVRDVKAGSVVGAFEAQNLAFPADAAVVLAFLLSLDSWCRKGNGEETGKDEGELHVEGDSFLGVVVFVVWELGVGLELRLEQRRWIRGVREGVFISVQPRKQRLPCIHPCLQLRLQKTAGGFKLITVHGRIPLRSRRGRETLMAISD